MASPGPGHSLTCHPFQDDTTIDVIEKLLPLSYFSRDHPDLETIPNNETEQYAQRRAWLGTRILPLNEALWLCDQIVAWQATEENGQQIRIDQRDQDREYLPATVNL